MHNIGNDFAFLFPNQSNSDGLYDLIGSHSTLSLPPPFEALCGCVSAMIGPDMVCIPA